MRNFWHHPYLKPLDFWLVYSQNSKKKIFVLKREKFYLLTTFDRLLHSISDPISFTASTRTRAQTSVLKCFSFTIFLSSMFAQNLRTQTSVFNLNHFLFGQNRPQQMPTFFARRQVEVLHLVGWVPLTDVDDVAEAPVSPVIVVEFQKIEDFFFAFQNVRRIFRRQIGGRQLREDEDSSEGKPTS